MKRILSQHRIRTLSFAILALVWIANSGISEEKPGKSARETPRVMQDVDGYTIRVVRLTAGSYGYEIRRGSEIFVRQRRNPFTGSETGLKVREDAMKTATWLVKNVLKEEEMRPQSKRLPAAIRMQRPIPRPVARELGIPIE